MKQSQNIFFGWKCRQFYHLNFSISVCMFHRVHTYSICFHHIIIKLSRHGVILLWLRIKLIKLTVLIVSTEKIIELYIQNYIQKFLYYSILIFGGDIHFVHSSIVYSVDPIKTVKLISFILNQSNITPCLTLHLVANLNCLL